MIGKPAGGDLIGKENAAGKRSPTAVLGCIFAAIVAAAVIAGCGISSSDSNLDTFLTPPPSGPTVAVSIDVTLTGSDTETCDLTFEIADPGTGTLSEITDQPCEPGSPNTDSAIVTYTADPDMCGPGEGFFTYTTNDGLATSQPATVTVDIPCLNIGQE